MFNVKCLMLNVNVKCSLVGAKDPRPGVLGNGAMPDVAGLARALCVPAT